MKNVILKVYDLLINLSIILFIATCTVLAGLKWGIIGAVAGISASFVFASIFFGFLLLIIDMRESLVAIKKSLHSIDQVQQKV